MSTVDLEPAARRVADLLGGIDDEQMAGPTPCPAYTLGDLVDHISGLTLAFTDAARKVPPHPGAKASGDASRLPADWRDRIPRDLEALVEAWRRPEAWTGMTKAGPHDLPGEVAGLVVLDELVLHGWDVARASGQDFGEVDPATLAVVHRFIAQATAESNPREDLFGPPVAVPDDAPLLDQTLGLAGRDPHWAPA